METRTKPLLELMKQSRKLLGVPDFQLFQEAERRVKLLEERIKSLSECSLVVALLGGTKVGKTTLVNALAGKTIGEASAKACFTSRPAVYVHKSREAVARSRLAGVLEKGDKVEIHEEAGLEGIILVDTPDFDGIEASHHQIFHRILERADLALCVVTTQKYDAEELFKILGEAMGARRTVIVFNRIDEGIKLTPHIHEDLQKKIAKFNLKPPAGETLPVFSVSALNGLAQKLGQTHVSSGEFGALENLLRERLDRAVIKQINAENLKTFQQETRDFVHEACHLESAKQAIPDMLKRTETKLQQLSEKATAATVTTIQVMAGEIAHRRATTAAETMGGPFGAYLRLSLVIRGLAKGFSLSLPSVISDPAEGMADRLISAHEPLIKETREGLKHELSASADRANFDAGLLLTRVDESFRHLPSPRTMAEELRLQLVQPRSSGLESLLLNLLPSAIILLLVRYFVVALLAAREPSAGMFIGSGMMFWLVCHLQTSLWLWLKAGSGTKIMAAIQASFLNKAQERFLQPVQAWASDVKKLAEPPPQDAEK